MLCDKMLVVLFLIAVVSTHGSPPPTESFKDQFCTDPRTMKKHAAYTEWADAYSCTRHRCQPGGRNLAIYTVGCKRVEAPESAIECEEVVEDTNMQFPFCCTRLRCLVVVRGEVWTRVLGQPWESLPAAPWSHMYKMKKPPPGDTTFLPKSPGEGPVYELSSDVAGDNSEKVLRSGKKAENPDCNEVVPRASVPTPDIVIALSTANDAKNRKKSENSRERRKRGRKQQTSPIFEEDNVEQHQQQHNEIDVEDTGIEKEKPMDVVSEEKMITNSFGVTQKAFKGSAHHQSWTEIPPGLWNDNESPLGESDTTVRDGSHSPDFSTFTTPEEKKDEKPSNLQALVDAIGTRMRDIENVVQKMSEKVHHAKPGQAEYSGEKKSQSDAETSQVRKHHKTDKEHSKETRAKRPSPDGDQYNRQGKGHLLHPAYELHGDEFSVRNRGSKYLHTLETTTEQPVFIEDTNLNGYFNDASNSLVRRSNQPKLEKSKIGQELLAKLAERDTIIAENAMTCKAKKLQKQEPAATYMAPVETRRTTPHIVVSETSADSSEKKHKKHMHKKKKNKGKNHKKHHKDEKKKRVSKVNSIELEKNVVSLEDSSSGVGSS